MELQSIIEELNAIEELASELESQLSEQNRIIAVGSVTISTTTQIIKDVERVDRKIQLLNSSNIIPGGWRLFDSYKANIRSYKGMDELDRDIERVRQITSWIPQSKAFVEFIRDLRASSVTTAALTDLCASQLCNEYVNSETEVDKIKHSLLIKLMQSNEARRLNSQGSIMNNFTINGDVNGALNVSGESVNSTVFQLSLAELSSKIEASDASPGQKASAKAKLQEFLTHPLVVSICGGLAG